ncbi:OsmC family protein [Candidatus Cloacimonadota bacterium]
MKEVNVTWLDKMAFEAQQDGHTIILDASEEVGGENRGCRPKSLLLSGLAGCTGMDVVSILKKMKITEYKLNIKVTADLTSEHPKIFKDIIVKFEFTGENLPWDKLEKAVELSETRYCGVSAMLNKAAEIVTLITINGETK